MYETTLRYEKIQQKLEKDCQRLTKELSIKSRDVEEGSKKIDVMRSGGETEGSGTSPKFSRISVNLVRPYKNTIPYTYRTEITVPYIVPVFLAAPYLYSAVLYVKQGIYLATASVMNGLFT
eukprot:SAG11_NODE_291_length_11180_cov_102.040155_15_plen_121_part_00